ncbi:hypothetical protein MTR67_008125 [Solanum verrucosum]|uniref:Uncharacterized protein n=1 Tax=Solanum verrucosum TaxID=315347 RepID=A0AAF0TIY0_SOLVR|nr:hypothetical protein MTR67_008125 [Solanum verrucosum]
MEFFEADNMIHDCHHNSHKVLPLFLYTSNCSLQLQLDYLNNFISYELPPYVAMKKDLKIKDVVKEHVLPLLLAKSLMKFKAVSKDWEKWLSSPLLGMKMSLKRASIEVLTMML